MINIFFLVAFNPNVHVSLVPKYCLLRCLLRCFVHMLNRTGHLVENIQACYQRYSKYAL